MLTEDELGRWVNVGAVLVFAIAVLHHYLSAVDRGKAAGVGTRADASAEALAQGAAPAPAVDKSD
jgi:hypothetical protein